jgi:uncharacterized protein
MSGAAGGRRALAGRGCLRHPADRPYENLGTPSELVALGSASPDHVDLGVSPPTIRQWLSVLEASHQIFFLRPHYENLGKRLIKAPKLYWLDTGMVCSLLGLKDEEAVLRGPMAGPLFETAVVAELAKLFYHRGLPPALWYWRSRDGWEVDLLVELHGKLHPVEIKSSATPRPTHAEAVVRWRALAGDKAGSGLLLTQAEEASALVPGVRAIPWNRL